MAAVQYPSADFCVAALEEALLRYGRPEIFCTDQGSQFASYTFTSVLKEADIKISMDGKGRWMDNVMNERLWRSLKYESIYLNAFETGSEARVGIGRWIDHYNSQRPHSSLDDRTPDEAYWQNPGPATPVRPSDWRHNHEGFPPYFRRQPVQSTGATSMF